MCFYGRCEPCGKNGLPKCKEGRECEQGTLVNAVRPPHSISTVHAESGVSLTPDQCAGMLLWYLVRLD